MKKYDLCLIGDIGIKGVISGGQIEKTRELYRYFKENYASFHFYNMNGKMRIRLLIYILNAVIHARKAMIITYTPLFYKELPFVVIVAALFRTQIFDMTIGGDNYKYLYDHRIRIFLQKKLKMTYVETKTQVRDFRRLGITKVKYQPTFKRFIPKAISEIHSALEGKIRLCYFGRITEEKGLNSLFQILERLSDLEINFGCSIYGPLDNEYQRTFNKLLNGRSDIQYKGIIPAGKVIDTLSEEDIFLFPSKHVSEGFPGVFIEAMAAGLVILSTEYEHFHEIIRDGYNGFLIKDCEIEAFANMVCRMDSDRERLMKMKENTLKESKKYLTKNVLKEMDKDLICVE